VFTTIHAFTEENQVKELHQCIVEKTNQDGMEKLL
jgi:hypothetical protein